MSDVMLLGVLRMPIDHSDTLSVMQLVGRARQAADRIESDAEEIERLRSELAKSNDQAKNFERQWYALDRLQQWADAYPLAVFPEPDLDKAHELLQAGGMTLDSISASNMRYVIQAMREIVDEGLNAMPHLPESRKTMQATYIEVEAEVRYWEDASVNGKEDTDGTLMPFKFGAKWCPVIRLADGWIVNWPEGTTADVHFKVCDQGEYWLATDTGRVAKWRGHYVPNDFLCHGYTGYGDYIIFKVGADGKIEGWKQPTIEADLWPACVA